MIGAKQALFLQSTTTENLNSPHCNNPAAKSPNYPVSSTERSIVKEETNLGKNISKYYKVGGEEVKKQKLMKKGVSFVMWPISLEQLSS